MISAYFGLPRCGKTTYLSKIALSESRKIKKGTSKYTHIYCNVPLNIEGVRYLPFDAYGKVTLCNSLYLVDEATIYLDNRSWKEIPKYALDYLALHGHEKNDTIFFLQTIDGYDVRFRRLTEHLYYVKKCFLPFFSKCYEIPYGVLFPQGDSLGEVKMGYSKPNLFSRLFATYYFRPLYYKYFDSYDMPLVLISYEDYLLNKK